jgi:hypothetical protein
VEGRLPYLEGTYVRGSQSPAYIDAPCADIRVLATPTLVALKVIAENTNGGKAMMEFLGPNDQSPDRDSRVKKLATLSR